MKWKVVHNAWWMFWARGMVFGPWIWLNVKKTAPFGQRFRTFRHELQHCYQIYMYGSKWKWYLRYIGLYLHKGYWKHPDEIDARLNAGNPLTDQEMEWYSRGIVELGR